MTKQPVAFVGPRLLGHVVEKLMLLVHAVVSFLLLGYAAVMLLMSVVMCPVALAGLLVLGRVAVMLLMLLHYEAKKHDGVVLLEAMVYCV